MVFGLQRYTLFFITENIILIIIVIDCLTNKYFSMRGGKLLKILLFSTVEVCEKSNILMLMQHSGNGVENTSRCRFDNLVM